MNTLKPGPIAERSNWLDHGRSDPSLNPGVGRIKMIKSWGCRTQHTPYCLCMLMAEDHEPSIGIVCEPFSENTLTAEKYNLSSNAKWTLMGFSVFWKYYNIIAPIAS